MIIMSDITVTQFVDALQKSTHFAISFHLGKGNRLCTNWLYGAFHDVAETIIGRPHTCESTDLMCEFLDRNRTEINAEIKSRLLTLSTQ